MFQNGAGKQDLSLSGTAFLVQVQFSQNASLQGQIHWLDGKKTVPFRSLLEMAMLISDALGKNKEPQTSDKLRTWDDHEKAF